MCVPPQHRKCDTLSRDAEEPPPKGCNSAQRERGCASLSGREVRAEQKLLEISPS